MSIVYVVFTDHPDEDFDEFQSVFLYQEDAMKHADDLNMQQPGTYSYWRREKVN